MKLNNMKKELLILVEFEMLQFVQTKPN